jgi:hypothetical protein
VRICWYNPAEIVQLNQVVGSYQRDGASWLQHCVESIRCRFVPGGSGSHLPGHRACSAALSSIFTKI